MQIRHAGTLKRLIAAIVDQALVPEVLAIPEALTVLATHPIFRDRFSLEREADVRRIRALQVMLRYDGLPPTLEALASLASEVCERRAPCFVRFEVHLSNWDTGPRVHYADHEGGAVHDESGRTLDLLRSLYTLGTLSRFRRAVEALWGALPLAQEP